MAKKALLHDDVPVGAVIVKDNKIIGLGENRVEIDKNPYSHAEIMAISNACLNLKSKFLYDCDIYITLEPCIMCCGAISFSRINRVFFAAQDEKGGGILTNSKVFETDKHLWVPKIYHMKEYEEKSSFLLKSFFKSKR